MAQIKFVPILLQLSLHATLFHSALCTVTEMTYTLYTQLLTFKFVYLRSIITFHVIPQNSKITIFSSFYWLLYMFLLYYVYPCDKIWLFWNGCAVMKRFQEWIRHIFQLFVYTNYLTCLDFHNYCMHLLMLLLGDIVQM